MAYAALVSIEQTINQVLNNDQYSISVHDRQQIVAIRECVVSLQEFLEDSPDKASSLEGQIRDVANETEDIIECDVPKLIYPDLYWIYEACEVKFDKQLEKVTKKIESIAGDVSEIKNSIKINNKRPVFSSSPSSRDETRGKIKDSMVGFDHHLMEMKTRLCGESSQLQIIPIVGMGGIGKTTLARNAYDDTLTKEYFDIRAWVTVSQDCTAEKVLQDLVDSLETLGIETSGRSNEEKVHKSLKGRRYLIIMDDIWSTNVWDDVRNIFPNDGNGSRIMLTTRLSDVAAYADSSRPHYEISLMDEYQSWDLLKQKVLIHQDCPPELEDIGKEIARSCRGLPLAIVVIAGLLCTVSKNQDSWWEIAENVSSLIAAKDGQFEEILSLSYTHLPHRLRPCFLYMGVFPEDHEIRVSQLVKLWVAEGFLKCHDESKSLEEVAEEYMEELVKRSLVLVDKRKADSKIKSCSLHDLMRDLCIRKAHQEKFFSVRSRLSTEKGEDERRIIDQEFSKFYGSAVHTIICFNYLDSGNSLTESLGFILLRVLDLKRAFLDFLPAALFDLFHLRYLSIASVDKIPACISKLQNLQTLIITSVHHPWKLTNRIWWMPRLRHIVCHSLLMEPIGISSAQSLDNLQTLLSLEHHMCTEGILKRIPNLKKLEIDCSFYKEEGTCLKELVYLHQLEKLILCSRRYDKGWPLGVISYPKTLKKLTLKRMLLPWDEMTIVGSLPSLRVLKLIDFACKDRTWETSEGGFPQLEFLLIQDSWLEDWVAESSHFPSLKSLVLRHCRNLRIIPDGIGEIPTLELIHIKGHVLKSLEESAKRIQEEQQDWGNDALKIVVDTTFLG